MARGRRAGVGGRFAGENEEGHELVSQVVVHGGAAVEVVQKGIDGLVRDGLRPEAAPAPALTIIAPGASMKRTIVGVMGPGGSATRRDLENARRLGALLAQQGWVVLCGGRSAGVMDAVCRGAKEAGGLTVGVLPGDDPRGASDAVDIAIVTGMGNARNAINVLSSDLVIACGMGAGTASEIALALKADKDVILLGDHQESIAFFRSVGKDRVTVARDPDEAIALAQRLLGR